MPHFLIKKEEIYNDFVILKDNENLFHICRVLRAKKDEIIKFIDEFKNLYICKITEISKDGLKAAIISASKSERYLDYELDIIQSVLMTDAQNLAVANATQSGIKKIYPVISDNTSVKQSSLENKKEKWQKIAYENFKQCERADNLEVMEISNLYEAINNFEKNNIIIYSEKDENTPLDEAILTLDKNKPIAFVIGPEGGFSDKEFEYFKKENYKMVSLGKLIYKAPNAIVAGAVNIISRLK